MCCNCNKNEVEEPLQFIIGDGKMNTPQVGTNSYNNSSLKYRAYIVFRNGKGILHDGIHYTRLSSGGFLLTSDSQFDQGTEWTIQLIN